MFDIRKGRVMLGLTRRNEQPGQGFRDASLGRRLGLGIVVGLMCVPWCARADDAEAARADFFEAKVRPILVERCYSCHSGQAKSIKGSLTLDSLEGMTKGGDTGPAVVPGKPDESLLIQAVGYDDDAVKMPPKRKMPEAEIAVLKQWVASGAAFPATATAGAPAAAKSGGIDFTKARRHWSYQPVHRHAAPAVSNPTWSTSPIDRFVLAKLEASGLSPSPTADRRTLLRRVYYDLIGVPPTLEEIKAFEADRAGDAFARVVDRLLASPRYGERWGRHWLDVARYADTKDGVLMFGDDRVRPYAYTYRDYVIRAFNDDIPYDQFVREQIAADATAPKDQPWRLAALGFLTLGRMFDNNVHDQIDDKIDTVSRGLLGLTVSCARCHDHKYDAIGIADYYSLYGVFAGSEPPLELPLIEAPEKNPACLAFETQAAAKRAEIKKFIDDQYALLSEEARKRGGDYLVHAATKPVDPLETAIFFMSLDPDQLRPPMISRWRRFLKQRATADDPVFGPWTELMKCADDALAGQAGAIVARWSSRSAGTEPGALNPLVYAALGQAAIKTKADVARVYADLIRHVYEDSKKAKPEPADKPRRQILDILESPDGPAYFRRSQTSAYMSRGDKDMYGGKTVELDRMTAKAAAIAPRAMVLNDAEEPYEPRVFVRGNPGQPGDRIPRRFLQVLAGDVPQPFTHGSGRLDLANAVADPKNPLTGRVIVNRVWMHHFGEPLVSTPSDFGVRSTPPSHPELLDDLTARFQETGWSIKSLHRMIVLSSTYQQASVDRPDCRKVDPENRLLWRANRRRLDFEAMRDTLLTVSNRLDPTMLGKPVDVAGDPANGRRTVYGMVDRQSLPAIFRAFDFANPDNSAERRSLTTVPQQALFSMNAPLVIEQARAVVARPEIAGQAAPEAKIQGLYRLILARPAVPDELGMAEGFLNSRNDDPKNQPKLDRLAQLAQVLMMTNEMMFVD
ncbi:PSD1 and planctomycete cytochrome C domain-containing protein [Paludisphaera borealis]|uniref:Cytochrome c domain-containing protein n=1 Tax=Paludisphaera borealis TaxID=1387353 RepID=A0A1U7CIZ4_9BACT|nr:PSD1 and planctomycete cytochrome C domain-containing protein [Paludisphaera borealis]APW58901.1 hypothetical protein BSF38_00312 [Paludisphaera borealis]